MTEGVALLAAIVSRYEVQIPTHLEADWARKEGESEEARRQRILKVSRRAVHLPRAGADEVLVQPDMIAAIRPDHLSLQFKRRTSATIGAETSTVPAEA